MVLAGVDQWTVTKPSRSDEVLDAVEQVRIANRVRAQIDSMAPKRPTKPNRSEPDSIAPTNDQSAANGNIPELDKLRSLQSQSHVRIHPDLRISPFHFHLFVSFFKKNSLDVLFIQVCIRRLGLYIQQR